MNYTKNHHLPQWDETDRILRTDFNNAMANIEAGLDQTGKTADSAIQAESNRTKTLLQRLAFDLCQVNARSLATTKPSGTPHTKGLAFNGLSTSLERSRATGFFQPVDASGVWLGPLCELTMSQVNSGASNFVTASVSTSFKSATASADLSVNRSGTITQLETWFHQTSMLDVQVSVQVKLYDKDKNRYVYTSSTLKPDKIYNQHYSPRTLDVAVPLEAGRQYRLELVLLADSLFSGSFGFGEENNPILTGTVAPTIPTAGEVTETLTLDSPASLAAGVMHYTGENPSFAMTVSGANMRSTAARQGISALGEPCTEREFYAEGSWSGNITLSARLTSSSNLILHDVEWYLI